MPREEPLPGEPGALGSGRQSVPAQDIGDAALGEDDAKLEQLPAEALIPPQVLPCEPANQGRNMLRCPGPARSPPTTFTVVPVMSNNSSALPGRDAGRFGDRMMDHGGARSGFGCRGRGDGQAR
jgi:hypothetical protein